MSELERLGREVRQQLGEPPQAWLQLPQDGLRRALPSRPGPLLRAPARMVLVAAAVFVAALGMLHGSRQSEPQQVVFTTKSDGHRLTLPDGSALALAPDTRARVTTQAESTRCFVEQGTVSFDVAPQGRRTFSVHAGALEVRVVGTRFSVSRDSAGLVVVRVSHGVVRALSPERSTPVELRGGDQLRAEGRSISVEHPAPPLSSAPNRDAVDPHPEPLAPPDKQAVVPSHSGTRGDDWQRLYLDRRYAAAVAAARRAGISGLLERLPVQQMVMLADAAYLSGNSDLALQALAELRRRFAGTQQARDAWFSSGRILAARGQAARARASFEAYLAGGAEGTYALEAMGRLVELYASSGDVRAKQTANAYLRRAPHGPYQQLCESVLAAP